MQQFMALMTKRFSEEILIDLLDLRVAVRYFYRFFFIDGIQALHPCPDRFKTGADALSAAGDTSARAGHHLNKMQVFPAIPDLIEQDLCIGHSAYDCYSQVKVTDLDPGLF